MEREDLKKRIEELKNSIISNSNDTQLAKEMVDEMLSVKSQYDIEPSAVIVKEKDIKDSVESETFRLSVTRDGTAMYQSYSGYTIIAPPVMNLAKNIEVCIDIIKQGAKEYAKNLLTRWAEDSDDHSKMPTLNELTESLETDVECFSCIMNIPFMAGDDTDLKYKLATVFLQHLNETFSVVMDETLKDETDEDLIRNEEFKNAVLGAEAIREELTKDMKS